MVDPLQSEVQLHDAVALADRARRARNTAMSLWKTAPIAAALCLLVAVAGRLRGWTPLVTLLVLGATAVALAVYVLAARRQRVLTDAEVCHIDDEAGLKGELRSAHWFTRLPADAAAKAADDWVAFHLGRAAERARAVDWAGLYPPPAAGRAKLATGLLAAGAVTIALLVPGGARLAATTPGRNAAAAKPGVILTLPPDLRKKLEDLLIAAETGEKGRTLTADEVRDLLAHLDDLAKNPYKQGDPAANAPGRTPEQTKADLKALAERAKKASESTELEPQVRDALSDLANKLNDADQNANAMSSRDPQDAAAKDDAAQQGAAQQSKSGSSQDGSSVQSVKEAAGGSSVGVVMMTNQDASNARDGGLGLDGGTSDAKNNGRLADLNAALRKETVEAAKDLQGDNVQTDKRRDTEHADATAAYTHAAAQAAERGTSTAPPPIPESRRAAVKSYFIRKK
jgi:hypothetical protein